MSTVTDHIKKTKTITHYDYDAFGRRTLVQDEGGKIIRTLYDGLSFDIIREQETFADGYFTNTSDTGIAWGAVSEGDGSRYRYIGDDAPIAKEQNGYSVTASNRASSRVALYANGQAVGVTRSSNYASSERSYFGTDLMGTVRSATTDSGSAEYYEYDVFGKPYGESVSDYAYTGKPYDPVTGMYNYGYRDYVPQTARFSTVDPIRDGKNWFAYCNNEPVNFLDAWGLFFRARTSSNKMNEGEWEEDKVGNGQKLMSKIGCAVAEMSNIVSSETQQNVTPRDINRNKDNFSSGTDNLNMQKVAEDNGLEFDYWTKGKTNLGTKLVDIAASNDAYYVSAQVKYNEDGDTHWVGVENVVEKDGKLYIEIAGSSVNDSNKANRQRDTWVKDEKGKMLVEVNDIEKIYTYKSNKNK